MKALPGDITASVVLHLRHAQFAARQGVQLLVFPELSLTGYELAGAGSAAIRLDDPRLDPLRRWAQDARMVVVAGAPVRADSGELHIASLVFGPKGPTGIYTKCHVHESEQPPFSPGHGGALLRLEKEVIGLAICRDATFPTHAASAARDGATVYAVSAMLTKEDYDRKVPLLRQYAREHEMFVLLANYTGATGGFPAVGQSAIWAPSGELITQATAQEETVLVSVLDRGL